ncbi:response regulator transcription factor [Actinoplanes sp. CA-030573]|uniref:response regulator transcription factor n=1 Tax=Actinoplanes sp. CA-030573 TaxID=3239898 RepID=UPI003D8CBC50
MARGLILIVDDEADMRDSLDRALRFEGYRTVLLADGQQALRYLHTHTNHADGGHDRPGKPDVVVLDVNMPVLDGLETCRRLRTGGRRLPILMLTARDAVGDRVAGLDAGADDYLVKPFALEELLARVRALIRRSDASTAGTTQPEGDVSAILRFADLEQNPHSRTVTRDGRRVELTRMEFNLLTAFLAQPGRVLTRAMLFELVWGYNLDGASKTLDVYIGYLRRKLEEHGNPRLIHTVRGVGFVLRLKHRS